MNTLNDNQQMLVDALKSELAKISKQKSAIFNFSQEKQEGKVLKYHFNIADSIFKVTIDIDATPWIDDDLTLSVQFNGLNDVEVLHVMPLKQSADTDAIREVTDEVKKILNHEVEVYQYRSLFKNKYVYLVEGDVKDNAPDKLLPRRKLTRIFPKD